MHYTKLFSLGSMALIACTLAFTACNKEMNGVSDMDDLGDVQAASEQTLSDLQPLTDEANSMARSSGGGQQGGGNPQFLGPCANVSIDSISNPHVMTIDFGSTNCLCNDGRSRRGQIIVTYSGEFTEPGHTRTITFKDFYVNDNQVTGTRTITNMGKNGEGQTYFNIESDGSIITDKGTMTHSGSRVRTWIEGEGTPEREDDVFSVTGSGTKVRANGKTMTMEITSPLIKAHNCRWISSGVIKMSGGDKERTIDFGNGECDNKATITANGKQKEITLR